VQSLLTVALIARAQDNYADSVVAYTPEPGLIRRLKTPAWRWEPGFIRHHYGAGLYFYPDRRSWPGGALTVEFNTPVTNDPADHAGEWTSRFLATSFSPWEGPASRYLRSHRIDRLGQPGWRELYQLVAPDHLAHGADDLYPTEGTGNPFLPVNPSLSVSSLSAKRRLRLSRFTMDRQGIFLFHFLAEDTNGNAVDLSSISYVKVEGSSGYGYVDAFSRVESVPEPSSAAMLLVGAGALGCCRKRRQP